MSPKKMFFFIRQNLSFSSLTDEKRKKRRLMKREKNDRSDAIFRRIDPVPSFFSFSVKTLLQADFVDVLWFSIFLTSASSSSFFNGYNL